MLSPDSAGVPAAGCSDCARWFRHEVAPHLPALRRYLATRFPTVPDHEDIVQDVLVRTLQLHRAGRLRCAKAVLFVAARNAAVSYIRRDQCSPIVDVTAERAYAVPGDGPNACEAACRRQSVEVLRAAIARLPPRTREVFLLRRFEGLSHREIAARCGIAPGTIETHMTHALQRCASYVREQLQEVAG